MVQIVIIEPHLLVRLGLTSLMACLTSAERVTNQSYDELYQSPPSTGPTDIVLLGAHPEERINLLIQATRRAHAPKRVILMSDTPTPPASWTNLPPIVVDYVCARSSGEAILSAVQPHVQRQSPRAAKTPRRSPAAISPGKALTQQFLPLHHSEQNPSFSLPMDEARMLGLSARQYDVLVLLAQGFPIKLICRELNITMATTKGHIEALYQRLGVHNRNEAVFVAMARGATLKMPAPGAEAARDTRHAIPSGAMASHFNPFSLRSAGG